MVSYNKTSIKDKYGDVKVIGITTFESISELVDQGKSMKNNPTYKSTPEEAMQDGSSWNGGATSYDKAMAMMYGQTKISDDIGQSLFHAPVKTQKKIVRKVTGSVPNVALSTMGVPNCMITREVKKETVTRIYIDISGNCGESADKLTERFKPKVNKIAEYMKSSDKVEINYYNIAEDNSKYTITIIKVKRFEQPISVSRMMAPLTNAVLFRVFIIPAIEVAYKHFHGYRPWGLGHPYQGQENVDMMNKIFGSLDRVYL